MCQVALERDARIVDALDLSGDAGAWRAEAERVRTTIIEEAWNDDVRSFTEHPGEEVV